MKLAVSSSQKDLEAPLDPRFGRCPYFLIVETDSMSSESFENQSAAMGGGAGVQAAQFVASKGAEAVITGNCGPKAMQVLSAAGVQVFVGQSGVVKDLINAYQNGNLTSTTVANVSAHAGTRGMGGGMGRGMGRGQGRGNGRGMGRGQKQF